MSGTSDDDAGQRQDTLDAVQSYPSFAAAAPGLFPAYSSVGGHPGPSWLQNTSFTAATTSNSSAKANVDDEARRLGLQQAADLLLPSSSSDSDSDQEVLIASTEPTRASVQRDTDVLGPQHDSTEPSHRKQKRQKDLKKRKKDKHERKKQRVEEPVSTQRRTDQEKIIELERRAAAQGDATRDSAVAWAEQEVSPQDMYYIDTRGDKNNIVYNGLYRADIAAYHRLDPAGIARGALQHHGRQFAKPMDAETDSASQRVGGRLPRYWAPQQARLERDRGLRRVKLGHTQAAPPSRLSLPLPAFIPLQELGTQAQAGDADSDTEQEVGESQDQYMMRRTKEFNIAVRLRPYELQLWLDYANFQDELHRLGRAKRGVQAGIAEKKISILERALEFHPGSDRLLMALLDAAQGISTAEDLQGRWQGVLARHGGSPQLWREYLRWQRGQYGMFAVSRMHTSYQDAVQALKQERLKRVQAQAPQSVVEETETAIVAFFIEGCRFDMQAGFTERAVASIQAALEYCCFAPNIPVGGERAKVETFQAFWEAGAPLVGDECALGWATWEAHQTLTPGKTTSSTSTSKGASGVGMLDVEEDRGGWGEWVPLIPDTPQPPSAATEAAEAAEQAEQEAEDQEAGEIVEATPEPTDEELLAQLGLQLEQQIADLTASDELPAGIMQQWAAEEIQRDFKHWQSPHGLPDQAALESGDAEDPGNISFPDIKWSLLGPLGREPQLGLVCHCLELLGAPLGHWQSSNATAAQDAQNHMDCLTGASAQLLLQPGWHTTGSEVLQIEPRLAWLAVGAVQQGPQAKSARPILEATQPWYQKAPSRKTFLSRLLVQLVSGPYSEQQSFCEALLAVEASTESIAAEAPEDDQSTGADRAREAAKSLLTKQRHNLGMWTAYALLESQVGQHKAARKVFNTALSSLPSAAASSQQHAAGLALAFAECELRRGGNEARPRAVHVLAWLGTGGPFTAFKSPQKGRPASAAITHHMITQARQGLESQLAQTLATAARSFTATSADLVAAAALFEELLPDLAAGNGPLRDFEGQVGGVATALQVFQRALEAVPEEAHSMNAALEGLQLRRCAMLLAYSNSRHPAISPGQTRQALLQTLEVHPHSGQLLGMLAECEQRAHTLSRLRLHLRSLCKDKSAAMLWLMAIKAEAMLPAGSHRVQALFEQAIDDKSGQHFPLLWRCYLSYELKQGHADAARRLLLRAIHTCPGAKALWLDGFQLLSDQMPGRERKDLVDLMATKGLKLRTDTYEILLNTTSLPAP